MEPLTSSRQAFTLFCVLPADVNARKWKIFTNIIVTLIILISTTIFLFATANFTYKFVLIDMEQALYGLFEFIGMLSLTVTIIVTYSQRKQLLTIFEKLQQIHDTCTNGLRNFIIQIPNYKKVMPNSKSLK